MTVVIRCGAETRRDAASSRANTRANPRTGGRRRPCRGAPPARPCG